MPTAATEPRTGRTDRESMGACRIRVCNNCGDPFEVFHDEVNDRDRCLKCDGLPLAIVMYRQAAMRQIAKEERAATAERIYWSKWGAKRGKNRGAPPGDDDE